MVALLGFFQLMQMVSQGLLGLPGRAVDALQHGQLLVAPPVGPRHPHQLEVAQPLGGWDVRAQAQIHELGAVAIEAHHCCAASLSGVLGATHAPDDLGLVGLIGEQGQSVGLVQLAPDEELIRRHDGAHGRLDPFQVGFHEAGSAGQFEVVIETIVNSRADGVLGPRPQRCDGLGQYVSGGVTQHMAALLGAFGDDGHRCPIG